MASDALVTLLTWDRLVPWKVLSLPDRITDDFAPVGFGSKAKVFRGRVAKGATIWVVTRPIPHSLHPPSLVAQITAQGLFTDDNCPSRLRSKGVEELISQWGWVAVADASNSRFFELNDASSALEKLEIRSFRVMRSFPGGTDKVREAFGYTFRQAWNRTVFLSYVHAESGSFALQLARGLRAEGFSPWLDSLTIPMYDFREISDPMSERLSRLIQIGLQRSRLAVVIATENYGKTEWTRREQEWICGIKKRSGRLHCVEIMRGAKRKLRCYDRRFDEDTPENLVCKIADWWNQIRG